jgi:hypothetical protein
MDNFQVNLTNILILVLWCVVIPCLSVLIYLLLSKSNKKQVLPRVNKAVAVPVLAFFVVSLLVIIGKLTVDAQTINPLCVGVGDPNQMMCFGRGFVPINEAISINSSKALADLLRTVGFPVIVSVCLVGVISIIQRMRNTHMENSVQ